MIQIQNPSSLFSQQKVFEISNHVDKNKLTQTETQKFKVLVLYKDSAAELSASEKEMVNKLIRACKFTEEETLLLNQNSQKASLGYLQSRYQPEMILIFGETYLSNNLLRLKKNSPTEINGTKILQTDSLEILEKIKGAKGVLWEVLKGMLNI